VLSIDSVNAKRENAENELAGLFYATIVLPDSAEFWYREVLEDYPSGRDAPRALYTLAQIYSGRDSVASKPVVDSLYREIVRQFPRSQFAPEARKFLGLPPVGPVVDDAEQAYDRAERLLVTGDSAGAAEDFKKLAQHYPRSPLASRALFAAGWIYENRLYIPDSAIATYSKLIALYPTSPYATGVSPKLAEVTLFQRQKLAAAADSLAAKKALQARRTAAADSLGRPGGIPAPGQASSADSLGRPGAFPNPGLAPAPVDSMAAKKRLLIPPRKTTGNE
jgi:outer membrane protein assembly factor BamD (BamD/ComL family)